MKVHAKCTPWVSILHCTSDTISKKNKIKREGACGRKKMNFSSAVYQLYIFEVAILLGIK